MSLALAVALLVTAGLAFIWHDPVADETRAEVYGRNLAATLAAQGVEAMLQADQLQLAVLANRMAAMSTVAEARFLDANNGMLAESRPARNELALTFSEPIRIGGVITGHAQLALHESAFKASFSTAQIAATLLLILSMPMLALIIGEWPRPRRPIPVVEFPDEAPEPTGPMWVAFINLYNQLAYPNAERKALIASTLEHAQSVAHLYQGSARTVTGTGVAVEFNGIDDAAFKATCASFLLLRVLEAHEPDAEFRVALHRVDTPPIGAEALADTALLAALAKEGTLLATPTFFDSLQKPERLSAAVFNHPMLEDVDIVDREAHVITRLEGSHAALLHRQVDTVLGYSTPSASTL